MSGDDDDVTVLEVVRTGDDTNRVIVQPGVIEVMPEHLVPEGIEIPEGAVASDPGAWGIVLADAFRFVCNMLAEQYGAETEDARDEIRARVFEFLMREIREQAQRGEDDG